ncbi:MAG: hypothetical protein CR980_02320, partial [Propionibacteriales bacterium]
TEETALEHDWQEPGWLEAESKRAVPESDESGRQADSPAKAPRQLFLPEQRNQLPAAKGWRGILTRLGMPMEPSPAEQAERADIHAVSQHWPGVRTIAVVNGKGGTGKTPSVAFLSAVFARYGASGVIAWDANHARGTLGWRTEQGPHEASAGVQICPISSITKPGIATMCCALNRSGLPVARECSLAMSI